MQWVGALYITFYNEPGKLTYFQAEKFSNHPRQERSRIQTKQTTPL
jgi:hypothetical protein